MCSNLGRLLLPDLHGRPRRRRQERGAVGHPGAAEARQRAVLLLPRVGRLGAAVRAAAPAAAQRREARAGCRLGPAPAAPGPLLQGARPGG